MKEKIIQRKYKRNYYGLLVIACFIFLVLLMQNEKIECQGNTYCETGVENMNSIWGFFIILLIVGFFLFRTDSRNYVEIEIEGNIIENQINTRGRQK